VLPRASIEAWLVALHTNLKDVEALPDPVAVLADKGLLKRLGERIDKKRTAYRRLVETLPALMKQRRRVAALPELDRFIGKVASRKRAVLRGG